MQDMALGRVRPSAASAGAASCLLQGLLTFLASAPLLAAQASSFDDTFDGTRPYSTPYKETGFHILLQQGVTGGGDDISTITLKDGTKRASSAGGVNQIGIGTRYRMGLIPLSIVLSVNYHYDYAYSENDNASFRRVPLEALAYLSLPGDLRIGAGSRYVHSARATSSIAGVAEKITFRNTRGSVVDIGYHVFPWGWVDLRYVRETYEVESYFSSGGVPQNLHGNAPYNGSHVGLFITIEN